jgi:16S rRNA (cytosine967-C5)-methyltransferase
MKKNERFQALQILTTVLQDKTPLTHLMPSKADLSPLTKDICFGVCRHYYRLSALADNLLNKRPKDLDLWLCLLIGLYQLHYLRIPDYAVVKDTVALVEQIKKSWAKGLVNAILRTYCREHQSRLTTLNNNPAFSYGHPEWLIQRLQKAWPHHWQGILEANDTHPPMSLRINQQQTSVADYLERLKEADIGASKLKHASSGMVLDKPCNVQDLPGFAAGDLSVQDEAAQLAVSLLDLKPGLRVLDACAAPGGKTCHILETEPELNTCIALDIDSKRVARIQDNLKRLHLDAETLTADALHPSTWWDGQLFDRILLDAPCSATGVIRRHPDIKLLRTEEDISDITELQRDLLTVLWPLLAPGGILVYATCSVMPEENDKQISSFLTQHPDAHFPSSTKAWGHLTGHGWQILPGSEQMDGFFYSVLIKQ